MNIFDALFGRSSAPPMSVGEMVGGAAQDPSQLMDQLANRKRTAAVTNYMLQDSPFSQIVQAPVRGAMGVADVLTGQKPYEAVYPDGSVHTSPQFIGDVADVAGSIGVGGVGAAANRPGSSLGIFGGRMARNAPLDDLARAEAMEQAGQNADDIWRSTGWGRGADGDWRFEIDDSEAGLDGPALRSFINEPRGTLIETGMHAFEHPDLKKSYQFDGPLEVIKGPHVGGKYSDVTDGVLARGSNEEDIRSVTLHELQHGVQSREGFARGSSPEAERFDLFKDADKQAARYQSLMSQMMKWENDLDSGTLSPAVAEHTNRLLAAAQKELDSINARRSADPYELYRRTAGEVEARNVQARRDFTKEERRRITPWETEDVPRAQQIVRKR